MQEIFEKIKDILRTEGRYAKHRFDFKSASAYNAAITILNEAFENVNKGNISDGYHTFNELYHHRAVLFSVICNTHKELAWKSKLHDTGDMYDGMFIVGIETPEGQATYHYDINPYWDMFNVKELPKAPKWDGHTSDEAIRRIGLFGKDINVPSNDGWIPVSSGKLPTDGEVHECTAQFSTGMLYIEYAYYDMAREEWWVHDDTGLVNVIAWREHPAPYKPKGEK